MDSAFVLMYGFVHGFILYFSTIRLPRCGVYRVMLVLRTDGLLEDMLSNLSLIGALLSAWYLTIRCHRVISSLKR